ncbi:RNA polymerase sigma factor SigJ [Kineosporia sp. A_224]|uniref:RNA polymerase sigma factor SigJ n=1 Tax=Kineosporia sp. A_224 TaxID=1962180 RepID=UPI000B4B3F12|nr:RNA polymerase sigma factor SigJ [Kineosporia sp. A_224]
MTSEPRTEELARAWAAQRGRLAGVAYAVLGSRAEAEDVVADCWLSLVAADARDPVRDVEAWATVAVARRALDVLRSARVRREAYVGPWLPEPIVGGDPAAAAPDPADRVTLDERVSYALMVVLEALTPAERTAWVLHDLFGLPFPAVAQAVGRTPAAVRQLAVRARAHVASGAARVEVDRREQRRVAEAFLAAAGGGDLAALVAVLDPDAVLTSDGGGVVSAARRPVRGADDVARFVLGIGRKARAGDVVRPATVNGGPGFVATRDGVTFLVAALTVGGGRVTRVDLVLAPDKLPR